MRLFRRCSWRIGPYGGLVTHRLNDREWVENYLRQLPWSPEVTEWEKTLVISNIRTFWAAYRDLEPE